LDQVVEAVLYEGYILYPYRASSKKNQQRFTFGRVYPEAYSVAQRGAEPFVMQTECLVEATAECPAIEVAVRFLHPMAREVGRLSTPLPEWSDGVEPVFQLVPELCLDGKLLRSWHEAVEREVRLPRMTLTNSHSVKAMGNQSLASAHSSNSPLIQPFTFPASRKLEPIKDSQSTIVGVFVRRREAVEGTIELSAQCIGERVFKVTVRIINRTPMQATELASQERILMRTFASTHTILWAEGAGFISLLEVPAEHKPAAAQCQNIGAWPVLVGDEAKHQRDTMLSSPIILYDYPKIAPESAGPLFDGTEIDELLTLRIMTMTDQEKREMRQVDERARRLLERTESLAPEELLRMHGVARELRSFDEDIFGSNTRLEGVSVGGVYLRAGDRVRLRPKARADIMDLALNGKTAIVEAVEQDAEKRVHLAVVIEDDPGRDFGEMRLSGHRFFYGPEEVEPVGV
jgi:hypothetical protein